MPKESFDQVLVFTEVKLHNQSKQPLFLHNVMTNATLDDGIHSSYAASAGRLRPGLSRLSGRCRCRTATALPLDD